MASSAIHLAVTKSYLKKNTIPFLEKDVLAGTLYPDTTENKNISHYTDTNRGENLIDYLHSKVNLYAFLKEHDIADGVTLGWFLHLVTDCLFFDECFDRKYLLTTNYQNFRKDLYHAYNCLNLYVEEKYHIIDSDYEVYPSEHYGGVPYEKCILEKDKIDSFVTRVSSIDLDDYIVKIKKKQKNVKP